MIRRLLLIPLIAVLAWAAVTVSHAQPPASRTIFIDVTQQPNIRHKLCEAAFPTLPYSEGDFVLLVTDNGPGGDDKVLERYVISEIDWPVVKGNTTCWGFHSRALQLVKVRKIG